MATDDPSTRSDFYVYALFQENGVPFYIGKGRGHRWKCHEWDARKGDNGEKCNIIRKMEARGIKLIRVKLHEGLTEEVSLEYEIALIRAIRRWPDGPLVNQTDGGGTAGGWTALRGTKQSPEHIAKKVAAHFGKKRSAEAKANMAISHQGQTISPEHRRKLAIANTGKKMSPDAIARTAAAHIGRKRSAETCANISAAKLGKLGPNRGRKWTPEHIAKRSATRRANNARRRAEGVLS